MQIQNYILDYIYICPKIKEIMQIQSSILYFPYKLYKISSYNPISMQFWKPEYFIQIESFTLVLQMYQDVRIKGFVRPHAEEICITDIPLRHCKIGNIYFAISKTFISYSLPFFIYSRISITGFSLFSIFSTNFF